MTDPGNTAANAPNTREIKAGFVRLLSDRIRETSADPKQVRDIVYELARVKLLEQFTHADARESRDLLQILERAIEEVERSFKRSVAATAQKVPEAPPAVAPSVAFPSPPPIPAAPAVSTVASAPQPAEPPRRPVAPSKSPDRPKRSGAFTSVIRLAVLLLLIAAVAIGVAYWPRLKTQFAALSQFAARQPASGDAQPQQAAPPAPPQSETAERAPDGQKEQAPPAQPSMPLPTTFGVYALSEGQLQELKSVPGKIPDRRVAISAAINTPSATTLTSGDVRFIVFRPDGGMDTSVTEVRVVAKVSRAMGVDATGKAAMVSAGDSWVIRSMSHPYKVGPVEDQPRMLLLQPEQDGFTLAPGRYVVVVKGMGYDFTVAGTVTDPDQCVERINATNGAFYSPCPPPR
ncbi:hypothetical protein [Bradyrhizobium guangzhouense]|uniref:Uncharacterized protein n=1 Tax=Bradyrhizobium guangzhouense TaxID=1325095 RepID=A0AAE5X502_9BRAD|nr:hypothetical protein [Bradyrhizobium guangzhouense]QAU48771.1 hypothetical protein XH91_27740 [Bradyrhizobium guangzhouense]RXH09202.1 hypothetical protein EAS56_26465 [Bradyrhizobium guangzhouense]